VVNQLPTPTALSVCLQKAEDPEDMKDNALRPVLLYRIFIEPTLCNSPWHASIHMVPAFMVSMELPPHRV
jgi:hypothetical protein